MDKARKKELLKAYADEQRQSFKDNLPMDEELFWNLFDYVDKKLETNDGCDHSLTFTREFLEKQSVDVESVLAWIITTHNTPVFLTPFIQDYGKVLKNQVLKSCGIKPVTHTQLTGTENSSDEKRRRFLDKIAKIASSI